MVTFEQAKQGGEMLRLYEEQWKSGHEIIVGNASHGRLWLQRVMPDGTPLGPVRRTSRNTIDKIVKVGLQLMSIGVGFGAGLAAANLAVAGIKAAPGLFRIATLKETLKTVVGKAAASYALAAYTPTAVDWALTKISKLPRGTFTKYVSAGVYAGAAKGLYEGVQPLQKWGKWGLENLPKLSPSASMIEAGRRIWGGDVEKGLKYLGYVLFPTPAAAADLLGLL